MNKETKEMCKTVVIFLLLVGVVVGIFDHYMSKTSQAKKEAELKARWEHQYNTDMQARDRIKPVANGWEYNGKIENDEQLSVAWSEINKQLHQSRFGLTPDEDPFELRLIVRVNPADIISPAPRRK
ncbi:MAG: hypothetical protein WCW02_00095 [Candidatus Buchananbacteria bacterium]